MAQSKQALRSRIKSVRSTRKITKAMEMIANAKLFKQRNLVEANRIYTDRLQESVNEIVARNPGVQSSLVRPKQEGQAYTMVFCSDLGLCGGYNANILKEARTLLKKDDPVVLVGTSMYSSFRNEGFRLLNEEPISSDHLSYDEIKEYMDRGIQGFRDGEYASVQLLFTRFINTMTFKPELLQLLPCEMITPEQTDDRLEAETMFEPDAETILEEVVPMMVKTVAYAKWMEATTSEQGSRRVAMKTATDNADELSEELMLEYNKARQAAITQEITEIVSGSNAV
ncbi:MAG: ATP synthase F1 subunit gamma [Solobacterium sp.]|nr:ATP synthase F1 subunit gamma [Erysipelotrichaceae bacterium]MBQ1325887.1 ATP synthase F1 subunit gamma [Solobacterium sp.]MBQ1383406.1 ATP synthase F1 subunit gamma [Solobacterium sp.]MBQ1447574.1 ATP synthase F1 subunit gamma [Solobacterium sp.]MBQ2689004.1 ATP synthase F1 subunit gamma [Solobacterium sp.]